MEGMHPDILWAPWRLGYVQGDPVVQQRLQNPQDPFGKRIEKLTKQLQFQIQQRQNAKIGRLGA